MLTWVKHILVGVSLFEHDGAVHQEKAWERCLPCPLRRSRHLTNCTSTDPAMVFASLEAGTVVHEAVCLAERL